MKELSILDKTAQELLPSSKSVADRLLLWQNRPSEWVDHLAEIALEEVVTQCLEALDSEKVDASGKRFALELLSKFAVKRVATRAESKVDITIMTPQQEEIAKRLIDSLDEEELKMLATGNDEVIEAEIDD